MLKQDEINQPLTIEKNNCTVFPVVGIGVVCFFLMKMIITCKIKSYSGMVRELKILVN